MFAPPYRLRPMTADDVDAVMQLERLSYPFPWSAGNFHDCLKSGYYACLLEDDELLAGYAVMSMAAGEAHVLNICIHPQRRGRGLGRSLLHTLEQVAKVGEVEMMLLEVRASNRVAISLYESMGFNELGCRHNYYPDHDGREDALVMARQLV
jgi:ribosomal-protein-alanine N-acetyltransferase